MDGKIGVKLRGLLKLLRVSEMSGYIGGRWEGVTKW